MSSIRPATPADREPVLTFCEETWQDGDYIHKVYDDWLADGGLFVGEDEPGRPVALVHLAPLPGGDRWLEGLRVARRLRRHGWGRLLVEFSVRWSREQGARWLSLMTHHEHTPMQQLVAQLEFEHTFDAQWYRGHRPAYATAGRPVPATATSLDLEQAQVLRAQHGLYARDWSFWPLTPQLLAQHLQRGEVVQLARAAAWAIITQDDTDSPFIAHLEGDADQALLLINSLWRLPAVGERGQLSALVRADGTSAKALQAAGFTAWAGRFLIYRRRLEPQL